MGAHPTVRISFLGAAGTVTGSKYLIEFDDKKVLVDCGLFQGKKELRLRNWAEPNFDPSRLDAIVLTHAHIDHTGYLPLVVRQGFRGPIYCTPATRELVSLLLPDSGRLQEEEARHANKYGTSRHDPARPLYTEADAIAALKLLHEMPRGRATEVLPGFAVTPTTAGHILGATSLSIDVAGKRLTFSGDIGRYGVPILPDPQPLDIGDLLVCESTYGNRDHPDINSEDLLAAMIRKSAERQGPIIIPAFALGRTQDLLFYLGVLERAGKIPVLPVFVDSPMAIDATGIYRKYEHDFDDEAAAMIGRGEAPLRTANCSFLRSVEESKRLNFMKGARIIIAASGMANGGRVLHHLRHFLPEEHTTVLFVGYQAEETRGRILLSGAPEVKIFGSAVAVRAKIEEISGLSAHGDRRELMRWLKSCSGTPRIVRITHGEPEPAAAFSALVRRDLGWEAVPAQHLETVEI